MPSMVVIGDVHGLTAWEDIVKRNPSCRILFLGDYVDPYQYMSNECVLDNLKKIISLKAEHFDDIILLLGNHDMHYITADIPTGSRFNTQMADKISEVLNDNRSLFTFAHQEGKCIFTHAGISQQWFTDDFKGDIHRNIAWQLNNPANEQQQAAIFRCGTCRGGLPGDRGGIFWADKDELKKPLQGFTQIVGHNKVRDIYDYTYGEGRIIFCDSLFNGHWLKIP